MNCINLDKMLMLADDPPEFTEAEKARYKGTKIKIKTRSMTRRALSAAKDGSVP